MMKSRLLGAIISGLWVFALTASQTAFGQVSINGSLRGRINDPGDASVAGASVKLTNTATATTQTTVSDSNGDYQFARIAPGVYSLAVEKEGFKRAQRENIIIAVNENAVADVTLALGVVSETITIEAGGSVVQAQSVELSGLVDERRVKELPHNLTLTHVLELPVGRGRALLASANGLVNALLGGWSLNGLAVLRSGEPINILRGIDFNDDGDATADRPALVSGSLNDLYRRGAGERTQYLIPQVDALTRLATPTTIDPQAMIPRHALRAPRILFYDLSLLKRFVAKERYNIGFEANFFNLFNRANFGAPVNNLSNSLFGQITSNLFGANPRQIQLGLKLSF
jgi:hypothetical protein